MEIQPSPRGLPTAMIARERISRFAVMSLCRGPVVWGHRYPMITLANSRGGCDQDAREPSDAVKRVLVRHFFAGDSPTPGHFSKGTSRAGFRQMDSPSKCPGTPCRQTKRDAPIMQRDAPITRACRERIAEGRHVGPVGLGQVGARLGDPWRVSRATTTDVILLEGDRLRPTEPSTRREGPQGGRGPQRSKILRGGAGFTGHRKTCSMF
jgi:hypothetical protein